MVEPVWTSHRGITSRTHRSMNASRSARLKRSFRATSAERMVLFRASSRRCRSEHPRYAAASCRPTHREDEQASVIADSMIYIPWGSLPWGIGDVGVQDPVSRQKLRCSSDLRRSFQNASSPNPSEPYTPCTKIHTRLLTGDTAGS